MNIENIPTPETTFRYEADKYTGGFSAYENMRDHAIDLERRLAVTRETLKQIVDESPSAWAITLASEALTLTAPKQ